MWCRGPPVDLGQSSCEALCAERSSRKREAKAIYIGMPCRRWLWYFIVQKSGECFAPLNKQNIYATSTQMSEGLQTSPSRKLMFHHIIKSYPNDQRSLFTPRGNYQNNPLLLAIPRDARPQASAVTCFGHRHKRHSWRWDLMKHRPWAELQRCQVKRSPGSQTAGHGHSRCFLPDPNHLQVLIILESLWVFTGAKGFDKQDITK